MKITYEVWTRIKKGERVGWSKPKTEKDDEKGSKRIKEEDEG